MALSTILTAGIGNLAEKIGGVVDRFVHSKDEQAEFKLAMETLLQQAGSELEQTVRAELQAKERVMVAELTHGDNYTKRARPSLAYFGMLVIFINYVAAPIAAAFSDVLIPELTLPDGFWYAWGGVVATWSVGRTMERRGAKNNVLSLITGNKPNSLLD